MKDMGRITLTVIVAYRPNDDHTVINTEQIWNELTLVVENDKGAVIVVGDLNPRVGSNQM